MYLKEREHNLYQKKVMEGICGKTKRERDSSFGNNTVGSTKKMIENEDEEEADDDIVRDSCKG